jgi:hypothetical protein
MQIGYPFRRMTRASRWLLAVLFLGFPLPALAQPPRSGGAAQPAAGEASPSGQAGSGQAPSGQAAASPSKEQAEAQEHFQRAKDLYQEGSYAQAVTELEAARALDPKAKDLVFNLGIVHEKLQKYDDAIADFRLYVDMEGVTPAERQKAESIIKRIEGAKREALAAPTATADQGSAGAGDHAPPPRLPPASPPHGRIDAATIGAAAVSVVGLGVGATFGILALSTRPTGFVTGRDGTYDDLVAKTDDAHTFAIVSDVGFAVGAVALIATAWLFLSRTKDPAKTAFVGAPGTLLLGGSFR